MGEALVSHPLLAGLTFTGSVPVGADCAPDDGRRVPRPCIAEMGGKNPCIVTARELATTPRSASCDRPWNGRIEVLGARASTSTLAWPMRVLIERLAAAIEAIRIGDPCRREHWLGPVVNERAYANYHGHIDETSGGAAILAGGTQLREGDPARGYYVAPALAELPSRPSAVEARDSLPILTLQRVADRDEAMRLANDSTWD